MHQRLMRKCNVFLCSMKFFNYLNFYEFLWQSTNCNTCFIWPLNRNSVLNCQLCFQVRFVVKACAVCCRVICLFHQLWNFQTVHVCLFFQLQYHIFFTGIQSFELDIWEGGHSNGGIFPSVYPELNGPKIPQKTLQEPA